MKQFDPEYLELDRWIARAESTPADWLVSRFTAELQGEVIGYGHVRRSPSMKPGVFLSTVAIGNEWRCKGFGSLMVNEAESQGRQLGATRLFKTVRDENADHVKFFEKRGYKTQVALATAELDLSGDQFDIQPWISQMQSHQIQLKSWSEIGDSETNRQKLFELFSEADKDEPGVAVFGSFGRPEFERDTFDDGYWNPDWLWVATFGEEWIGMHQILRITESGSACGIGYTGVVKHHRGKGIGRAMKQVGIATAQKAGFTKIKTNNDKTNAPMLKINEQLGFQSANGWLFMGKDITG